MELKNMSSLAIAEELGNRLKQARLRADLTQSEVASRSGLSRRTILKAEKGKVQLENLVAILGAIGMVEHLNMFLPAQEISPIQLAKLKGQQRQRASRSKKRETQSKEDKPSW
ncbi:MAG: helix-turn-helix domain-containing protein [Deltaproteobacteria bacterium]|nr:helix-turn-helix domain-containing protein [Deltaproteobacteria bacterium]